MDQFESKLIYGAISFALPLLVAGVSYLFKNMLESIKKQDTTILENVDKLADKIENMRTYQHIIKTEISEVKGKINEMEKWIDLTELTKVSGKVSLLLDQTSQLPKVRADVDAAHEIIRNIRTELHLLKRNS